jgi:hypothetical protein
VRAYAWNDGYDTATMTDSFGADTFLGQPRSATLMGPGFLDGVQLFDSVTAVSQNGGTDVAKFLDSVGNDTFVASPTGASITGSTFVNTAVGFPQVNAWSTAGGTDSAELSGSSGTDQFWAYPSFAYLTGSVDAKMYYFRANSFEKVTGYSKGGANDTAHLFGRVDGAGNPDTFVAGAIWTPGGSVNPVTRAIMSDGVYDGSDIRVPQNPSDAAAAFTNYSYLALAEGFHTVLGESQDTTELGKNDIARIFDYAYGADTFTGSLSTGNGTMTGSGGYTITAKKFHGVAATGDGVNDSAILRDSSARTDAALLTDWLEVDYNPASPTAHRASLYNVPSSANPNSLNQIFQAFNFKSVSAQVTDQTLGRVNRKKIHTSSTTPDWTVGFVPDSLWHEDTSSEGWGLGWL